MALSINGTTGISGVDGSASAPVLTGTDSNTGINFGSDIVNINTGGSTRVTVDNNVGIGASSPEARLHVNTSANDQGILVKSTGSTSNAFQFDANRSGSAQGIGSIKARWNGTTVSQIFMNTGSDTSNKDDGYIAFGTESAASNGNVNATERMRLASNGRLLIGRTSASSYDNLLQTKSITVETDGDTTGMQFNRTDSNAAWVAMRFRIQGTQSGFIQVNTGSVTYSTSSDYRLKENVVSISDGITRLKQLKPYRFNFKNDSSTTLDGFYAHEASEVVPESVVGEKDAMEKIYYKEGDTLPSDKKIGDFKEFSTTEINPQGIDQSKLVPLLTAALQEAIAKIEVLETKVAALEAA